MLSVCNNLAILYEVDTIIVYAVNVARRIRNFCLICMRLTVADILLHTQARRTIYAVQNHGRQHQCGHLQERESAVSSTRNHLDCPPPSSLLHAKMARAIHQLFDTFRYFYFDFKYALQRQSQLRNCWTSYCIAEWDSVLITRMQSFDAVAPFVSGLKRTYHQIEK